MTNRRRDREPYFADYDGRIFKTEKAYREYARQKRASTVPHEMAIESLLNDNQKAKKYGFRKAVVETVTKWYPN